MGYRDSTQRLLYASSPDVAVFVVHAFLDSGRLRPALHFRGLGAS